MNEEHIASPAKVRVFGSTLSRHSMSWILASA